MVLLNTMPATDWKPTRTGLQPVTAVADSSLMNHVHACLYHPHMHRCKKMLEWEGAAQTGFGLLMLHISHKRLI